MSYEVTATRRRPQQFDDLVGQEFVAETLKNAIKTGRIAHAYLFSGPRGCGKTSTARILAKALNCQNGPTDKPCCTCSNCQEITKGSSLDVIEIDGASNTSVENIRQIKDEVMFPPANCRYKIYIIDEVHMLSTSAFNALLKTIEEPPEYVIFIFATTELQKVPATIKSRCQQYNFRLVSIEKVKNCLAQAAEELGIQTEDEALFWIARESTGSMRDAYTLFDQIVAFSDGVITYEKIRDKLGLVGVERLNTIFESCAKGNSEEVVDLLDDFLQAGISIEQLISNSADYLRSLLLIKNGVTKEALLGNSVERYSSLVLESWNVVQIERALSIYLQLYRDIRYSLSPRYELELAFSRLCWLKQFVSNAEVKKAIDAAQSLLDCSSKEQGKAEVEKTSSKQIASEQISSAQASSVQTTPVQQKQGDELLGINPIPNGLPRLSGLDAPDTDSLDSVDEFSGAEESSENQNNSEAQNPFSNGGPLPPEQSVAVVDERLKLHIPEQNYTEDGVVPTVYIPSPTTEDKYSLNPDDDWSNTEVPPDDNYYPEEESFQEKQNYYEQYENPSYEGVSYGTNVNNQPRQGNKVQSEGSFTTADGRTITFSQLKGTIMANFSVNDSFVATALEKTGPWIVSSDSVDTTVPSAYDFSVIQKNIPLVNSEISRVCGKQMQFKITVENKESSVVQKEVPLQVKILVDMFKGSIVNS